MIPPGKRHSVRLCATFVRTVNVPGRYGDGYGGLGLSLLVTPRKSGGLSKTWAQAVSPNGTKTSLGLGSWPVVTLAMARDRALANARAIAEGRDPRRRMQQVPTFAKANETVLAIHAKHWKSERTEGQWRASMRDYVLPRLARKRVDAVTTADVMAVLLPIWSTKRVTAGRVPGRGVGGPRAPERTVLRDGRARGGARRGPRGVRLAGKEWRPCRAHGDAGQCRRTHYDAHPRLMRTARRPPCPA